MFSMAGEPTYTVILGGSWMWVAVSNMPAISLYSSLGFRIAETDGGYYRMQLDSQ